MLDLSKLQIGCKGAASLLVAAEHTAPRVGSGRVAVLATPVMINLIEAAALAAVEDHLPPGHQSLGIHLDVRHFAATPAGMRVTATAELTAIDGRTLTFRVEARDEREVIGAIQSNQWMESLRTHVVGCSLCQETMNMARMMLLSNQLDSAAYYLKLVKDAPGGDNIDNLPSILQTEALCKIQSGALIAADSLLKKCWQMIEENNTPVNSGAGTVAPDYYLALLRIQQSRFDEAITLLEKDIVRLLNNRVDILRDYKLMAELYHKTGKTKKAAEAYAIFIDKKDSLLADQERYRSISFESEQQMNEKERSIAKLENKNKISSLTKNFSIGVAVLLLLIAA